MDSNTVVPPPARASDPLSVPAQSVLRPRRPGHAVVKWFTTTDHKTIGTLYLVTSFAFFCIGGVMALFMRA
ncbi:cytochrome ubiquinol oxidase subunit I, partial [Streptomyces sp. NPDC058284]